MVAHGRVDAIRLEGRGFDSRSIRHVGTSGKSLARSSKQNKAFLAAGPSIWNGLPLELRSLPRDFSSSFYIVSLRPSFLPGPGLGALLSSYL